MVDWNEVLGQEKFDIWLEAVRNNRQENDPVLTINASGEFRLYLSIYDILDESHTGVAYSSASLFINDHGLKVIRPRKKWYGCFYGASNHKDIMSNYALGHASSYVLYGTWKNVDDIISPGMMRMIDEYTTPISILELVREENTYPIVWKGSLKTYERPNDLVAKTRENG